MSDELPYHNPIGRFMVAAGAVIELEGTGKILVIRRKAVGDDNWHEGTWEVVYGRIAQGESPEQGLRREVAEEVGITDLTISRILTAWHIYRGAEVPENEVVGITYATSTRQEAVTLSAEHDAFRWVTAEEALLMIEIAGIQRDIRAWNAGLTQASL